MNFSTVKSVCSSLIAATIVGGVCLPITASADPFPIRNSWAVNWQNDGVCDDQFEQILEVRGQACHGANIFNDRQLTNYANAAAFLSPSAYAFWSGFKLPEMGQLNTAPGATDSLIITDSTPVTDPIASHIAPGITDADPNWNPASVNVPLNDAYIPSDFFSAARSRLPIGTTGVHSKLDPVRNEVVGGTLTIEEWNAAVGRVYLGCRADGSGFARIQARNLIPHQAYSAWTVFSQQEDIGFGFITAAALGGAPNYMVASAEGKATFERNLHYCPLEMEDDLPLMYVALFAHVDHVLYGATPDGFGQGWPTGPVGGDHVCFPVGNDLYNAYDPGIGDPDCGTW